MQIEYILIRERDDNNREERRNCVSHIVPVDLPHVASHEGSDNHKGAAGGPRGEASKDGGEEDRDEEKDTGRHCCETCLPTLCTFQINHIVP